ncbi:MFS transporter [Arthrobacter sp. ERGS1:01]|uniref:MFS transporter n=1 Tax=Arthrobacter sp. ERGS1:01 TaxID=1704044 RepID=UPI00192D12E3|nr:MFS transporter [Arthrobacter sp. ERGS1:01]
MAIFLFINYADKSLLGLAGTQIRADLGITVEQYGIIQSAFFWIFAIGAIVLGALASRVNLRWYLAALMLVWVATMIPLMGTVGFTGLLVCRLVLGFAEGPAYALANHSAQSMFPPEKRALASGIVTAGSSLGPLVMAPILTWIIVQWSWHTAFGVLAVAGIVWAALWLLFGGSSKVGSKAKQGDGGDSREAVASQAKASANEPVNVPYRVLLGTTTVIGIALLNFFSYWSTSLKVAWLPVYLSEGLGYSTLSVGRLIGIPFAAAAVFSILAGFFSNWLYKRGYSRKVARGYLAGGLVVASGVCMWAFTVVPQGVFQMVLVTLAFSLNTASIGVGFTALGDLIHSKKRGGIMGGIVAFSSLAGIVSPLFIGFTVGAAANAAQGYDKGFAAVGIMMVVGAVVATALIRPDKDLIRIRKWADANTANNKETL